MNQTEWTEVFETTRLARGLTQEQAATLAKTTHRTVQRWEAGLAVPPDSAQPRILAALRRPISSTTPTVKPPTTPEEADALVDPADPVAPFLSVTPPAEDVPPAHHLHYDPQKGWVLRCTFNRGPKLVGLRKKTVLGTRDQEEARQRTNLLLREWTKLGLKVTLRLQRAIDPAKKSARGSAKS